MMIEEEKQWLPLAQGLPWTNGDAPLLNFVRYAFLDSTVSTHAVDRRIVQSMELIVSDFCSDCALSEDSELPLLSCCLPFSDGTNGAPKRPISSPSPVSSPIVETTQIFRSSPSVKRKIRLPSPTEEPESIVTQQFSPTSMRPIFPPYQLESTGQFSLP